jgi:hypothetical protein
VNRPKCGAKNLALGLTHIELTGGWKVLPVEERKQP